MHGVEKRILGAFVALAAVFALLFFMGARTLSTIATTADRVQVTRDVLAALDGLQNALVEMETADRGFALSWDESFTAPFDRALPRARAASERIAALTADNPLQVARLPKLTEALATAIATIQQSLEETRTAATPGDEGADRFRLTQSKTDAVRAVIDGMRTEEEWLLKSRIARSDLAVSHMRWAGGALGATCVTLLGLAYILLRRDATRRGLALDAVRESERRFRHLADNAPVMIWMADGRNANYHFNRTWREFTGRTNEQEAGWGWLDGVHPADHERVAAAASEADRSRQSYRTEYRLRRADGVWRWVIDTGTPRTGAAGEPEGFIGSCLDITDRRESEDQMRRLNRELGTARDQALEASRLKSAFLANMSHELRTPLNGIIGYAEMLMQEDFETVRDHLEKAVAKIHSSGRHLLAIINDILDLSKIEAGKVVLLSEEFEADSIAREAMATVEAAAGRNRNVLGVHVARDAGIIASDSVRVKQVLLNLLSNACKFTEDGKVELDVSRQAAAEGDWLIFRVSDTGIGMDPAEVERLFQDFTQADGTTTRKYGGTGLGLSISRRLARLMGGEIQVRSEPGRGSVFSLLLPASGGEPVESTVRPSAVRFWEEALSEDPSPASDRPRAPGVVLAIDDDEHAHAMLESALRRDGLELVSALSGIEGVAMARRLRPSVIVLDVMMPEMDGWTTLSKLKADPETRDIPVVMLTMLDDRPMGYALGANDYLLKPLERDSLRKAFERHGLRTAAERITRSPDLPPPSSGQQAAAATAAKPRALVVEDDPASQDLMRFFLQREGWQVEVAPDGVEALAAIAVARPDIILLDLMMPRMDGFEFLAELRSIPETMKLPVIVMTAKDLTADDRARLEGAVQRIVEKGATPTDLLIQEVRALVNAAARSGRDR